MILALKEDLKNKRNKKKYLKVKLNSEKKNFLFIFLIENKTFQNASIKLFWGLFLNIKTSKNIFLLKGSFVNKNSKWMNQKIIYVQTNFIYKKSYIFLRRKDF